MKSTTRRPYSGIFAGLVAAAVLTSCDEPTRPPTEGSIAPLIAFIQGDTAAGQSAASDLEGVIVTVTGNGSDFSKTANLTQEGFSWRGRVTGVPEGTYTLRIEGRDIGGQTIYFGRNPSVSVVRGATANPSVLFEPTVPPATSLTLVPSTNFSQPVAWLPVQQATNYTLQWSTSSTFTDGTVTQTVSDTNFVIQVDAPVQWFVRVKANLPNVSPTSVPFSPTSSFTVQPASGGNSAGAATPVTALPQTLQTITNRNVSASIKTQDWFSIDAVAGDTIRIETFAKRLDPASPLNTRVELFRADGTTSVALNDDLGAESTDSRLAAAAPATENYKVLVSAAGGTSGHFELQMQLRRLPRPPTGLVRTIVSGAQVNLSWVDGSDNETGYAIDRCSNTPTTCTPTTADSIAFVPTGTVTFQNTGLTPGNYTYRVRAIGAAGYSLNSPTVVAVNVTAAQPTGLDAVTQSVSRVALSWTDVAVNETGYEVERCSGVDCGAPFTSIRVLPANTQAWEDSSVVYNTSYSYRVRALAGEAGSLNSTFTDTATATTIPPAAATGLTASVVGPTQINLAWTNVATNATGYVVERCDTDACTTGFAEIASLPASAVSYQDTDVANNAGYGYRVRAFNVIVSQETSNIANADTRPPAAPTGLAATTLSATSIGLVWVDNADDETGYTIERCTVGACTFVPLETVAADVETYTDATAVLGESYTYRVVAVGIAGNSTSNEASANTIVPDQPTGLTAQVLGENLVRLTWSTQAGTVTQWQISRCTGAACTPVTVLQTVPFATTTYDDGTVAVNQLYTYVVRALNNAGASVPSDPASASTVLPPVPTNFTATTVNATRIDLAWTFGAGTVDTVRIERCLGENCDTFVEVLKVLPSLFTAQDIEVTLGNVYTYRIRTQNAAGFSAYAPVAIGRTTVPATPTALTGRAESATSASLTWVDNATDETSYQIERCDVGACTFALISTQGFDTQNYTNNGLTADTVYQFRVRALNAAGPSEYSNVITIATKVPGAPEALVAQPLPGLVRLSWADTSSSDEGTVIERCDTEGCSGFGVIATIAGANQTTYDDNTVALSNNYRYRVRFTNGVGESANSVEAAVSTFVPNVPTALATQTISATRIDLSWNDASDNESGFRIERCTGNACGSFAEVATVTTGTTLYQDVSVTLGNEYTYRVIAVNVLGESAPSTTASANTMVPSAPTALVATTQPGNQIGLAWAHDALNVLRYDVLRCTGAACTPSDSIVSTAPGVLAYTDVGLATGLVFRYSVRAVNAAGASPVSNVSEAATNYPADPIILTADPISPTRIRITWQDVADNEDGYVLERCVGENCSAGFQNLAFLAANVSSFEDEDDLGFGPVTAGAYYGYRVRAFNGAGQSRPTDVINVRTFAPKEPTEVVATVLSSVNIRVDWTDQADNESLFRVERCAGSDGCTDFAQVATLPVNSVSYNDTDVVVNQVYRYRVFAVNPVGDSPESGISTVNTLLPTSPSALVATTQSASQVALTWDDNATNETTYRVERCADASCAEPVTVATLPAGTTSFQDATVNPEATYCYRVVAENIAGQSAFSDVQCASTRLPGAPTALATLVLSSSSIRLTWADNSTDEDGFKLERCAGPGCGGAAFNQIATIAAGETTFDDAGLSLNTQYRYRLRAFNAAGNTAYTEIAGATISIPTAPSALGGTIAGTTTQLSWTDGAINEASFRIERCDFGGCNSFVEVGTAAANPLNGTTTFEDVGVPAGTTLRYRVRAANAVGFSGYTTVLELNTDGLPADPTGLTATTNPTEPVATVALAWTDNANNEDGYRVERCIGASCTNFTTLIDLPADATSHQDIATAFEESYRYRVQALRVGGGGSGFSNVAADNTIRAAAPTDLVATSVTNTRIDLAWTDNSTNEFGFRIERCLGVDCATFGQIAQIGPDQSTYVDNTVPSGESATYRVRAFNGAAVSAPTNISTAIANLPAIVAGVVVEQFSNAPSVRLSWATPVEPVTEYVVYRCAGAGCVPTAPYQTLAGSITEYEDSGISLNEIYRYAVVATNATGAAPASAVAEVNTTVPATVSDVAASIVSATELLVQWSAVPFATGYVVERCEGDCVTTPTYTEVATVTASPYTDTDVVLGESYSYRVRAVAIVASAPISPPAEIGLLLPASPTALSATTASATQVNLAWTNNANNATGVRIERCAGVDCELVPSNFAIAAVQDPNVPNYQDAFVASGESYSYRVIAVNAAGTSLDYSNVASATTNVPQTPVDVEAIPASANLIQLSWTNPGAGEDGFRIERCDPASCTYTQIDEIAAGSLGYDDASVTGGAAYRYRIRAFNAAGNSGYSAEVDANTFPPSDPASLRATPSAPTEVLVQWTHPADNRTTDYLIERCEGASCDTFTPLTTVPAPTVQFTDVGLTTGNTYRYRVSARNAADTSAASNEGEAALVTPANPDFGPLTPLTPNAIQVEWVDQSDNETSFSVLRCNDYPTCGDIVVAGAVGPDTAVFVDTLLTPGKEYSYQVVAANPVGTSAVFGLGTAITPISAPGTLTATLTGVPSADLAWSADFAGVSTVRVERCTGAGCGSFALLVDLAAGTTTYQDASVVIGESYNYRVTLLSDVTVSPSSNVASADVVVPPAPVAASVVATTATSTRLFWTFTPGAELGFKVERCEGIGCTFTEIATLPPEARQYDDVVGNVSNPITYRVLAFNVVGTGAPSPDAVLSVDLPAAPVDVLAMPIFGTRVDVMWSILAPNAVGYTVQRCEGDGCQALEENFTDVGTVDAPALVFTDNGVAPGTAYTYRVRAFTGLGESPWSAFATTLTAVPAAPTGLVAEILNANNMQLTWVNSATNAINIRVERCTGLGCGSNPDNFAQILQLGATATSTNDLTTVANTAYSYRIRAVNNIGSSFSDVVSVNTDLPAAATSLAATPISGVEVQLSWTDNAINEVNYVVQRCSGPGCSFSTVATLPANTNGYLDATATFGTSHEYRIFAVNPAGVTPATNTAVASTVLDAPTQARAFTVARQAIRFRWTHSSPIESGYEIQRCIGEDCELIPGNFNPVITVSANDTSYVNTGLAPNSRYGYRVRAVTNGGQSDWSPVTQQPFANQLPFARTPQALVSGVAVLASDAGTKTERHYVISVPANVPAVTITTGGGSGDPDLYVRRGAVPVAIGGYQLSDTLCVPYIGGTSESCTFTTPVPGDYYIMLQAYSPYDNVSVTATNAPTFFGFQTCGASGAVGPTQVQCNTAYGSSTTSVSVVNGIQNWTVPFTGRYRVYARGAAGASATPGFAGGRGAQVQGDFNFTAGQVLSIVVGQAGAATVNASGGGGGGSFVVLAGTPLMVGGGGGGMRAQATQAGCDAQITPFGGVGTAASTNSCVAKGGSQGLGGSLVSSSSYGAGGGGFFGNGADDFYFSGTPVIGTGGRSWAAGLFGGTPQNLATCTSLGNGPAIGGFGGGGAGNGCFGGGGGGGYSGGDGGWVAGGGGSWNTGANPVNTPGVATGNGLVALQYIGPAL